MKYIFGILGLLLLSGCAPVCEQCEVCVECPKEQALLSSYFDSWGENIEQNNEYILKYAIYNYGLVEAKNVTAKCYIESQYGKVFAEQETNIGSVGSTSLVYKEMYIKTTLDTTDSIALCYVKSCDNCILLDSRIKENQEYMK